MKKMLLLSLGGAVGFVLGARAGRPAYDRLTHQWTDAKASLGLSDLATSVKEAGVDVRDAAVGRASAAVSHSADDITTRIEPDASVDEHRATVQDDAGWQSEQVGLA